MIEAQTPVTRADADIAAEIEDVIVRYPPLAHDRNHLHVDVRNGMATISGHLRTYNTRDFLLQALESIDGLRGADTSYLHIDDGIRIAVGRVIPVGVFANAEYGTVVLSGELPDGTTVDELVSRVGAVPGVRRVIIALRD